MKASTKAIRFLESLSIPEGPKAGQAVKLAPFQKQFVKGALADGVNVACLSIGRGNPHERRLLMAARGGCDDAGL